MYQLIWVIVLSKRLGLNGNLHKWRWIFGRLSVLKIFSSGIISPPTKIPICKSVCGFDRTMMMCCASWFVLIVNSCPFFRVCSNEKSIAPNLILPCNIKTRQCGYSKPEFEAEPWTRFYQKACQGSADHHDNGLQIFMKASLKEHFFCLFVA